MKQIIVQETEAGQRMDKLLARYLPDAPKSFLYKMLRKKNITRNGKKADGSERALAGDEICFFLSDETYGKFAGSSRRSAASYPTAKLLILYEDEHILLVNKPAGMLTQKAAPEDVSLNEYLLGYLERSGQWTGQALDGAACAFRPSICNRLDRNTSGIVVCGKTLTGLRKMSELFRERRIQKDYLCLTAGRCAQKRQICGYLWKDPSTNKVEIRTEAGEDTAPIETEYRPIQVFSDSTLLEVRLITGRSHQIRAHLASEGHQVIGDYKYGSRSVNEFYKKKYRLHSQLLHAGRLTMPTLEEPFRQISGRMFEAEMPTMMKRILDDKESEKGR